MKLTNTLLNSVGSLTFDLSCRIPTWTTTQEKKIMNAYQSLRSWRLNCINGNDQKLPRRVTPIWVPHPPPPFPTKPFTVNSPSGWKATNDSLHPTIIPWCCCCCRRCRCIISLSLSTKLANPNKTYLFLII